MSNESSHIETINTLRKQLAEKEAENKQLSENLDQFRHAAEGANDGLWDWNLTDDFPSVSPPWKTMLGFKPDEDVSLHGLWEKLLHPEDKQRAIKEFEDFIATKTPTYNSTFRLRHTDGSYRWIRSKALLKLNNKGEVYRVSGAHTDITESKLDTIELQKVNFELDSFVYHASHDLRSPLRSILGLINIYRHEPDEYLRDEYIDRIEQSINKLDHLIQELLSISRNDRINDPFVSINFMMETDHSVDNYYNALDTDHLSLEVNIRQPTKFVSDLTRVKIILNNIISNAIKYRDNKKELSKVTVDIEVNTQKAIIKIIDNGEGIAKDQIPHIFDMFHRASDHSEGSGLGLYIVRNVINKLNGKISVTSKPYVETIFKITIPNMLANK